MDYFFVDPHDIHGTTALLKGDEYKHLARVLRKREGEHITLIDGNDHSYDALIRLIDAHQAECEILHVHDRMNEPRISVTLAVSLLRNPARLDVLVEKTTESGVRTIIPMLCERTIPRSDKHARLEKIALSAMKQCGRSYLPRIEPLRAFDTLVGSSGSFDLRLIPHEKTEQSHFIGSVLQHHPNVTSVLVLVGPEGGFTDEELTAADRHGFVPISLGPRRLRTETAAISAVNWIVGGW